MSGWLAYREDGSKGEWTPITTDLVAVNPNQFRDAKGRFAPTPKELEGIDNQRDVNEFLYGKIQEVGGEHEDFATQESLANEAEMRRTKDDLLQDQINSNQSQIDQIQEKGYDDTEIRALIDDEVLNRSLADIGVRDGLQHQIDILKQYSFSELDDKINIESETRRVADQGLQAEITSLAITLSEESNQRKSTDTELQGQIDSLEAYDDTEIKEGLSAEITAREEGDTNLQSQIDAISEKGYDDTEIREGLAKESEDRKEADLALAKQVQDEKTERSLADIGLRDSLQANIDAIEIPSLDGYATEEYVDGAIDAIEFPETDLSEYAKAEYVDAGDANLQTQIDNIEIPSIDGLATEEWVTGEIEAIEFPETDLTNYYTKGEVDKSQQDQDALIAENTKSIGDEAQARSEADAALDAKIDAIEIPSLEGYATEEYVDDAVGAIEFPETDLTAYAKTEYVDAGDSNLQEQIDGIEIPSLDGYATEGWVSDQIDAIPETDLSNYYTKTEVDESQSTQDDRITVNEGGIASNAQSIEVEAEVREQEDNHLQAEIDQIALALEALLVQREAGQWKYIGFSGDNIPRNPGEFSLLSDDLSSSENNITINQTDLGDKFHGFAGVAVGDYVEIVDLDKPDEYALFIVDSEPNGTGIVSMNLKLKDKGNNFLVGTTCEIRFFQLNEQDLDLTELDARYLTKKGGKTDGILILGYDEEVTNNEAAAQIGFVKTHVDEAIQRIPPPDLSAYALTEYVDDADLSLQQQIDAIEIPSLDGYATEEYVDSAVDSIEFPETDLSNYYTKQEVNESQQSQDSLIAGNTSSIEGEAQARADADTALDAKIDAIEIPSLEGYATEDYVDTAIEGIEFPETDLTEYAKTTYVDSADASLQGQIDALEAYDDSGIKQGLADEVVARETGDADLQGQIDAIEIPSLDGYATEEWVSGQIDAIPETDLTEYAKTDYVDVADQGLQSQIDALEIPSLEGYATEEYVDTAIDAIEFPETDLSAYAKTEYVDAADASLQQQIDDIDIPSLEGYATEEYVDTAVDAIEFPETDLSDYYTKGEVDASQLSQNEKITANEQGVAKNKGDIAYLQTGIDANAAGVDKNKGDIAFLQSSIDTNAEGVEKNKNDIAYLQTGIDANAGGIEKNKGDILILDGDIKDNTAAIEGEAQTRADADAGLQSQIDAIEVPSIDGLATEDYVDGAIDAIEFPETDLSGLVSKTGGDDMEGPLHVKGHSGDSRGTSRVKTLGVFSDSSSALRLGTTTDRVYIEDDNTKFNGGVLVNNIGPKTEDGRGVTLNVEGTNDKHLVTKKYVDNAVDAIEIPESPDLSNYVSKTAGDQTMTGPLTISGLGTWKGSRIKLDYVTANSESSILKFGTPENEENLRVYKDKVKISSVPLLLKTIHGFASGHGTYYEGAYTEPNHIATKKDVDEAMRQIQALKDELRKT
jgi:hypothetical protein